MSFNTPIQFYQPGELDKIFAPIQAELDLGKQAIQNNLDGQLPLLAKVIDHIQAAQRIPLRSILLVLSARLFSYTGSEVPHVASVLEYLNTAAALHQKIILTEEFRRNQKDLSNIWGNEASVLLGDYLLSIAFKTMTRLGNFELLDTISATTQSIARGQVLSISPFFWKDAESHALEVIRNKKASLFMAGVKCGAILGNASQEIQQALNDFGSNLGMGVVLKKELSHMQNLDLMIVAFEKNNLQFPLSALMRQMHVRGQQTDLEQLLSNLAQENFSEAYGEKLQSFLRENRIYDYTQKLIANYLDESERALIPLTHLDTSSMLKLAHSLLGPDAVYPRNGM